MRKAYLQMHLAILLWGFTGILGKAITMSEGLIVWYRMLITAISLAVLLWYQKKLSLPGLKDLLRIGFIGLLISLHWVTFYASIKVSNVSVALSCFSSVALFSAFIEPLYKRRRPNVAEILLGVFVIIGISIIFSAQQLFAKGIVLALISSCLAAWFTVLNKTLADRFDSSYISFYEMLTGFIFLSVILLPYLHYTGTSFEFPDLKNGIYLMLLSLFCTTLAFTISMEALKKISAFTMNLSVNLEPIYSIILAILIFKEDKMLNTGFYFGTAIILSSVVFHSWVQWQNRNKTIA